MTDIEHDGSTIWGEEYNWIWETTITLCPNQEYYLYEETFDGDISVPSFPSDEDIRLFSLLPVELVRLIFEKTMEDRPWPLHLLLVSKEFHRWLEPLIYQHLCITTGRQWKQFYLTFCNRQTLSPANSLFERNVRSLFIATGYERSTQVCNIVKALKNLHSLAVWDDNMGYKVADMIFKSHEPPMNIVLDERALCLGYTEEDNSTGRYPYHLRRFSFPSSVLYGERTFKHPVFNSITHLDVYFRQNAPWETLTFLKQLIYISIDMVTTCTLELHTMAYWIKTLSHFCPTNVKVIIFGCMEDSNVDFDLMDSDGRFLPPGWFAPELKDFDWMSTPSSIGVDLDINELHPFAQVCLGYIDPRTVVGSLTDEVPEFQMFRDCMVYFAWSENVKDWDGRIGLGGGFKECWTVAEEIIEMRKGLTYADFVQRIVSRS